MSSNILTRFRGAILRAFRNHQYEVKPDGRILMPKVGVQMGGVFRVHQDDAPSLVVHNTLMKAALSEFIQAILKQGTQRAAYYIGLYKNDVDPPNTVTSATLESTLGEFTHYSESTRQIWTPGDESNQQLDNSASLAIFTSDATGGGIWGAFLSTTSAKSSNAGLLVCAAQFPAQRSFTGTSDKLSIEYDFVMQDGEAP